MIGGEDNFSLEVLDADYRELPDLLQELRDLVRPSYESEPAMLFSDIKRCERAYLLRISGRLVAFFLVSFLQSGVVAPSACVYLGLSATAEEFKASGTIRRLFERFTSDAREFQKAHQDVFMFGTLATPSSYRAIEIFWTEQQPRQDGSYDNREKADHCRRWLGAQDGSHPFVLKKYALGTAYSVKERARVAALCQQHRFTLFAKLGVAECDGDRLLVTCGVPRS